MHVGKIKYRGQHRAEDRANTFDRGGGAEHMTSTLDRGGSAEHMADILRRSNHAEDRANTLDRGGGAEHMADKLRRSSLIKAQNIALSPPLKVTQGNAMRPKLNTLAKHHLPSCAYMT